MCARVLVAEDNLKQSLLIRLYLEDEGYSVDVVADGRLALESVRASAPDLLVLDGMLPSIDGLEVCRILRRESDVPILMLTARSSEPDLLMGLDRGADDYMTKPFSPAELVARARTLLRRTRRPSDSQQLIVGGLVVDSARHVVTLHGEVIECTPGEFTLLEVLAAAPGRVFSRPQLLAQLHGFDRFITERTIDVHVKNLRKKIEPQPRDPRILVTVYGTGYKLQEADPDAPA